MTTVTGTLFNPNGTPAVGKRLEILKVLKNGALVQTDNIVTDPSNAQGVISFNVIGGSVMYVRGHVEGLNQAEGVALVVPDQPAVALEALLPVTVVPPGLTYNFISLLDTPATYAGHANEYVRVNASADGLNFAPVPVATPQADGLMAAVDKAYLDSVPGLLAAEVAARMAQVNGLTTTNIPEGNNLYFTNGRADARADARIAAAVGVSVQANLGYVPANKAGDTFTGNVGIGANPGATSLAVKRAGALNWALLLSLTATDADGVSNAYGFSVDAFNTAGNRGVRFQPIGSPTLLQFGGDWTFLNPILTTAGIIGNFHSDLSVALNQHTNGDGILKAIRFKYSTTNLMSVFEDSTVGINIHSSLAGQLHILSKNATTRTLIIQGASGQSNSLTEWQTSVGGVAASMSVGGALSLAQIIASGDIGGATLTSNGRQVVRSGGTSNNETVVGFGTPTGIRFMPGGTDRMYLDNATGFFGIGLTVPLVKLHVQAAAIAPNLIAYVPTGPALFVSATRNAASHLVAPNAAEVVATFMRAGATGTVYSNIVEFWLSKTATGANADTRLDIALNTGGEGTAAVLSLAGNGNVGVGMMPGAYKLDVNGNARVSGSITVGGTALSELTANFLQVANFQVNGAMSVPGYLYSGGGSSPRLTFTGTTIQVQGNASDTRFIVKNYSSQSGAPFEVQDSVGVGLLNISAAGFLRWGTTDAAVMLKPNGTQLQLRLAADGGDAGLRVGNLTVAGTSASLPATSMGGNLTASAANSYDLGQSAFPFRSGYFGTHVAAPRFNFTATVTPSGSADAQGAVGDMRYDDNYVYVKVSTGWKRAALAAF